MKKLIDEATQEAHLQESPPNCLLAYFDNKDLPNTTPLKYIRGVCTGSGSSKWSSSSSSETAYGLVTACIRGTRPPYRGASASIC